MTPLVSVLLPNLNNRLFLEERIATIRGQSLKDWELIVVDNHSDDGAWELLQHLLGNEKRARLDQEPRKGMYANWNNCIKRASGRYVYIATSDDTMAEDCLERLSAALERSPECGLAHCRLRMIDQTGNPIPDWWSDGSMFGRSSRGLLDRFHTRRAPFDGLLHLGGESVYVSITQLLIRRSVFDRVGLFSERWGSMGDFNWNMRASLVVNTVHVPGTWATWRIHPGQATVHGQVSSAHRRKIDEMIEDAISRMETCLEKPVEDRLRSEWAPYAKDVRHLCWELEAQRDGFRRWTFVLSKALIGSRAARQHLRARVQHTSFSWADCGVQIVEDWLNAARIGPNITC